MSFLLLSSAALLVGCDYSSSSAPQQVYQVTFYVENVSETQPATDLLIRWDTTVVAQDTFRYTNVSDSFRVYQLTTTPGEHHIRVVNKMNNLQEDSTIIVRNPQTHVFTGFSYNVVSESHLQTLKSKFAPDDVAAAVKELNHPPYLGLHIMEGDISVP